MGWLSSFLHDALDRAQHAVNSAFDQIEETLDPLVEDAKEAGERLGDVAGEIGNKIEDAAGEVRDDLADVADQAGETFDFVVLPALQSGADSVGDAVSSAVEELKGSDAAAAVEDTLKHWADVFETLIPDHNHDQNQLPPDSLF